MKSMSKLSTSVLLGVIVFLSLTIPKINSITEINFKAILPGLIGGIIGGIVAYLFQKWYHQRRSQ